MRPLAAAHVTRGRVLAGVLQRLREHAEEARRPAHHLWREGLHLQAAAEDDAQQPQDRVVLELGRRLVELGEPARGHGPERRCTRAPSGCGSSGRPGAQLLERRLEARLDDVPEAEGEILQDAVLTHGLRTMTRTELLAHLLELLLRSGDTEEDLEAVDQLIEEGQLLEDLAPVELTIPGRGGPAARLAGRTGVEDGLDFVLKLLEVDGGNGARAVQHVQASDGQSIGISLLRQPATVPLLSCNLRS